METTNNQSGETDYGSIHPTQTDDQNHPLLTQTTPPKPPTRAQIGWGLVTLAVLLSIGTILYSSITETTRLNVVPSLESGINVPPLSTKSPVGDLGLEGVERMEGAAPSVIWGRKAREGPIPTNRWYLNLVSHRAEHPDDESIVYATPYFIDTSPPLSLSGIRIHFPAIQASDTNIQMVSDYKNSITLGTSSLSSNSYGVDQAEPLSQLGVSLRWTEGGLGDVEDGRFMKTSVVRGMAFATMVYAGGVLPTLYSYNAPASGIVLDGGDEDDEYNPQVLTCGVLDDDDGNLSNTTSVWVNKEVKMHFRGSDFTWLLFFSQPVEIECGITDEDPQIAQFLMNVATLSLPSDPLYVRLAMVDQCTTGKSDIHQHCETRMGDREVEEYAAAIRGSSHIFPTSPTVRIEYSEDDEDYRSSSDATVHFDWNAKSADPEDSDPRAADDLLVFALPHHREQLTDETSITNHCVHTFHGRTCLVRGSKWSLSEDLGAGQSFTADRPPEAAAVPVLAAASVEDIEYEIPDNLMRGAADTYFSGKILAKVARVVLIASELRELAEGKVEDLAYLYTDVNDDEAGLMDSIQSARLSNLPSSDRIQNAIDRLKGAVQVWLSDAEAPYVYDDSWGGLVNCGCIYVGEGDKGVCNNTFPDCPALESVNQDFGNGFYNDHHFHYGYHVYAAAVVAKFDPKWGKQHFEKILLYIRDYANPSENDPSFSPFRQKDMWLGSSWASGIVSAENSPHGRDQESSSEAIASYEAMALFGKVMTQVMDTEGGTEEEKMSAKLVQNTGELLTVMELKAADRYWHVYSSDAHQNTYPAEYTRAVVGMMYDTMASFQTWFSSLPLVSYGIQLMPFTPVAGLRDDPEWASQLYPTYVESCEAASDFCVENGWSIIQAGLCATAGMREDALEQALAIPKEVFKSDGGVGQSMSNTIWYIATRKDVAVETN